MGTNTTGGTNDRTGNVNRKEVAVENSTNEEIERLKRIRGYGDATFIGIEVNVTKVNQKQKSEVDTETGAGDSADTAGSAKKPSEYVQTGNQTILNVHDMSEAINKGVSVTARKTREPVSKKKPETKDRDDN